MRDRMLLHDMLLFLDHVEIPEGFSRLKKDLLNRIDKEMRLDQNEMRRLCNTFIYLYDSPKSDCQPTKPWELLISKIRKALVNTRPKDMIEDPIAFALLEILKEDKMKKIKIGSGHIRISEKYLYPFRPDDKK